MVQADSALTSGGVCLAAAAPTPGARVGTITCDGTATQRVDGCEPAAPSSTAPGLCLAVGTGTTVVVATCAGTNKQLWTLPA